MQTKNPKMRESSHFGVQSTVPPKFFTWCADNGAQGVGVYSNTLSSRIQAATFPQKTARILTKPYALLSRPFAVLLRRTI